MPNVRLTLRFAVVNLLGIYCFFGPGATLGLAALSLTLWGVLAPVGALRRANRTRTIQCIGIVAIAALVGVFVLYKRHIDSGASAASAGDPQSVTVLYSILRTVSFSYIFLRAIDLIRSVAWGVERTLDPVSLTGYLGPFHMLIAGPITPYREHVQIDAADRPNPSFIRLLVACNTIVSGLFLKVVVAQSMKQFLFGVHGSIGTENLLDTLYLMAYVYFDFAGYSLIALGIGRLLDVPTPKNFDRPYLAMTVTEFWTRWHISLGVFVRNNLFLPLQLFFARRFRTGVAVTLASVIPLALAFFFVAMWHRFTVNFLIWGAAMAVVLVAEKLLRPHLSCREWFTNRWMTRTRRVIGPLYTIAVITISIHFVAQEVFLS